MEAQEFGPAVSSFGIDAKETGLRALDAGLSFRLGVPRGQKYRLNLLVAMTGLCGLMQPVIFAVVLSWVLFVVFCALILWRLFLVLVGLLRRFIPQPVVSGDPREIDLPIYTVMIAAYNEAAVMPQLAAALHQIKWPQDCLDILILLEADDNTTIVAAEQAAFPICTRIIRVPPGGPRTKPNALNYGLTLARGAHIVVYDVEDLPHPNQLYDAFLAFQQGPQSMACVQAPLRADNPEASWISAHWALEYDVQFELLLPGISLYQMPLLIGGTSNHFRREALLALGGWDAWNVTEDADLGMRIARAGLRTGVIGSATLEDAPTKFHVWLPQRGRWIKGYVQTWLVLMRRPRQTLRQMGLVPFLVMQLSLGGAILAPLAHVPFALLALISIASGHLHMGRLGLTLFATGYLVSFLGDLAAPGRWSPMRCLAMLTKPLYWPLISLAAYRAIWDLANRPFFWAKTPHQPRQTEPRPSSSIGSSV